MSHRMALRCAIAFAATLLLSPAAQAQIFRAYLDPAGLDTNPCTLPAPCRLLPAALAAVADGGEIWMLDSANYNTGPVNITKSVTILAVPGALGSVVATAGNAINIATAGVKVVLRNLVIVPVAGGSGLAGVNVTSAARLTIEKCLIANLPSWGVAVDGATTVRITDTTIRGNGNNGVWIQNGARATLTRATISGNGNYGVYVHGPLPGVTTVADIADSTLDGNNYGLRASAFGANAAVKVTVRDSRVVRNLGDGLSVYADTVALGTSVTLTASNNIFSNNLTAISITNPGSNVLAVGNAISGNGSGLVASAGGVLNSTGDNAVRNNPTADLTGTANPILRK